MIRVLLDANVYFAGFLSKTGASALVLELAKQNKVKVYATRLILREADRNLAKKTNRQTVSSFHHFLKETKLLVLPDVDQKIYSQYESVIHHKDAPILAAALTAKVDYLITLDRKHFLTEGVATLQKHTLILTPGDFIRELIHQTA